jgi:hypothetical protein
VELNFPKIIREVSLSEYVPELTQMIKVWVNPPVKVLDALSDGFRKYVEPQEEKEGHDEFLTVLADLLSQGEPATRWTVEELKKLRDESIDTDPRFFWWFQDRVARAIYEHRAGVKKA